MSNRYDISMYQGATFQMTLNITDSAGEIVDLTGYSARMQIRSSYIASTAAESMTSDTGEITITANTGTVAIVLSAARTAAISFDRSTGKPPRATFVYDLELEDADGIVTKPIYGDITIYMSRSTTNTPIRVLEFDMANNTILGSKTTAWLQGTATIGNFMEVVETSDGTIKYVYVLQNTGTIFARAMVF